MQFQPRDSVVEPGAQALGMHLFFDDMYPFFRFDIQYAGTYSTAVNDSVQPDRVLSLRV